MDHPNNDLLLKALARESVFRTPVWLMRQAGRYLPEYRQIRQQIKCFQDLYRHPELACEVTLQPLQRFDLDAAIIFKDILTIPEAMGMDLSFLPGQGPVFRSPLRSGEQIEQLLSAPPEETLPFIFEGIRQVKAALSGKVPLIGFSGSPWTLAAYMVEGSGSKTFSEAKRMLYARPDLLHKLLNKLSQAIVLYLRAQIEAGCDVVMLFDTWGGLLGPEEFQYFSLDYIKNIISQLPSSTPVILFAKNGGKHLSAQRATGCSALGVDWTIDIMDAYRQLDGQVAIQGNLDPMVLYAQPADIERRVTELLDNYGAAPGHIFNLGHGILPDINPDHVQVLIETVARVSQRIHGA